MNFLVIGSGAREDVIVWSLLYGGHHIVAAPGNPGMERRGAKCFFDSKADDTNRLLDLAQILRPDVTVVGSELPLSLGIVDRFREIGLAIVGPSQKAAQLETSKSFAKGFMRHKSIPTAAFIICETFNEAVGAIKRRKGSCVVKADGLCAGKGAFVCSTEEEAITAARQLMTEKIHGEAGARILVEKKLEGPECSAIFLCDGLNAVPLKKAQDYKRRFDNDEGPNTGGMGAICPVYEDPLLDLQIMDTIVKPTLIGMAQQGTPFTGFLYVGLMLTADGPQVIEYNVRLGDPETSVILPLMTTDLGEVLLKSTQPNGLSGVKLNWRKGYMTCVVPVSHGYPGKYQTGFPIWGIVQAEREQCHVFDAGTAYAPPQGLLVTAGGRVLNVVGYGATVEESTDNAYRGVNQIKFKGMDLRRDIGRNR